MSARCAMRLYPHEGIGGMRRGAASSLRRVKSRSIRQGMRARGSRAALQTGLSALTAVFLVGCSCLRVPNACCPDRRSPVDLGKSRDFSDLGFHGRGYVLNGKGGDLPVLLLHEISGIQPGTRSFANRLSKDGFTVYLPALMGSPEKPLSMTRGMWEAAFGNRWYACRYARTNPIVDDIRPLCRAISQRHGGKRIVVIGMCLTGAFPVALLTEEAVQAGVCCQPTIPLLAVSERAKSDLGFTPNDLQAAIAEARAQKKRIMAIRFQHDPHSPPEKFATLRAGLGELFDDATIREEDFAPQPYPKAAHSTMTACYVDTPGHPTRDRYEKMVAFLRSQIGSN